MTKARTTRHWSVIVLSLSLTFGLPLIHSNANAELYIGLMGGGAFPNDLSEVQGKGALAGISYQDLDLKTSGMLGGKLGYYFPKVKWLGVETEIFYARPSFENQTVSGTGAPCPCSLTTGGTTLDVVTWAINGLVRYPGKKFQPYAGLGLGIFFADLSLGTGSSTDNGVPGLNALLGARYLVTPHFALFAEYKYNRATFTFERSVVTGGGLGDLKGDYSTNIFAVGLAYHF